MDDKYKYDRFGQKSTRAGQAAYDILEKQTNEQYTPEDILDSYAKDFYKSLEEAIELGSKDFDPPFYILYLMNKEPWAVNVVRGRFVRRQTEPTAKFIMQEFPNFTKVLYEVDIRTGKVEELWTLPGIQEMPEILKHPLSYSEKLYKDVRSYVDENPLPFKTIIT